MLINLTNHPVQYWENKQLQEAEKLYGTVTDLPFPFINPAADESEIKALAREYADICSELLEAQADENNAVHIMGEFLFCFFTVNELLNKGIQCISSATDRNTRENNGVKTSVFNFVRFREYSLHTF